MRTDRTTDARFICVPPGQTVTVELCGIPSGFPPSIERVNGMNKYLDRERAKMKIRKFLKTRQEAKAKYYKRIC